MLEMYKITIYIIGGLPQLSPRHKPSHFTVVSIHGHEEFWANQKNLAIVKDDATVVQDILMHHRPKVEIVNM